MPVHAYTVRKGTEQKLILVHAHGDDGPAKGLTADSDGVRAAFGRDDGSVSEISLSNGVYGEWSPGGFVEVDRELLPGVYQLGLPDDALREGAARVVVVVQAANAQVDPIDIDLVAFDQQDSHSLGMVALTNEARMACLSGAFPLLARSEQEHARGVSA